MRTDLSPASSSKRKRQDPPAGSGQEPGESSSAPGPSKRRKQASGPVLKRADTFPARLPSQAPQGAEVKPVRHPITRPLPDTTAPVHFTADGNILAGSRRKFQALDQVRDIYPFLSPVVENDPEFKEIIRSRHPNFASYSEAEKAVHADAMLGNHPRYIATYAKIRNLIYSTPNGATATRPMELHEQRFLTRAFRYLKGKVQARPYQIHGETAVIGNKRGKIVHTVYSPKGTVTSDIHEGDKYHLHTHPPFMEPFTSSASEQDHKVAADLYSLPDNQLHSYVTNGKDVLHILPDSMGLVKLTPDPRWEEKLGKFPVAFELPDPQRPTRPFSNHEAPAAYRPWNKIG